MLFVYLFFIFCIKYKKITDLTEEEYQNQKKELANFVSENLKRLSIEDHENNNLDFLDELNTYTTDFFKDYFNVKKDVLKDFKKTYHRK